MSECLNFNDFLAAARPQVDAVRLVGARFSGSNDQNYRACQLFTAEVRKCEGTIRSCYAMAAQLCRGLDADVVAQIWKSIEGFCEFALSTLKELKDKYPDCGTPELYDLALDYKLACHKRHQGAMEEATCQKAAMPANLFPDPSSSD